MKNLLNNGINASSSKRPCFVAKGASRIGIEWRIHDKFQFVIERDVVNNNIVLRFALEYNGKSDVGTIDILIISCAFLYLFNYKCI